MGRTLMIFVNRIEESQETPPSSCRDRGWMWGRAGALCLSSSPHDSVGFFDADGSNSHEDRHKAPSSTQPFPLSLQEPVRQGAIDIGGSPHPPNPSPCPYRSLGEFSCPIR